VRGARGAAGRGVLPDHQAAHRQHQLQAVSPAGLGQHSQAAPNFPCRDSCQKGWRLLYILTAYYRCSEVLRPFLLAFLQGASGRPELPFHGISKACEQNFRKTLQFGGRSLFPSSMELKAMVAGRSAKRQLFLLPGGIERHLKIKTCSVAQDVIEELCCEMGLQRPEAFEEYILFVVTDRGEGLLDVPPDPKWVPEGGSAAR
uniref:MyTH4 domain-containing protein n=1 Tax=Anas zonorhyncha TaxID=75864 RepID=A0A8B9VVR0_9AVES